MAYQNVGTPRFFIDHGLWLHGLGMSYQYETPYPYQNELIQLNPSHQSVPVNSAFSIIIPRHSPINYTAFLGHNGGTMYPYWFDGSVATGPGTMTHINGQDFDQDASVSYKGFSIFFFNDNQDGINHASYSTSTSMGAISVGSTYTMPHSPDLKLTMSREMEGVKRVRTKGGADLIDHHYTKPPLWGSAAPWELYQGNPSDQNLSRIGRRTWDLSFSYLQDSDVFGSNQSIGIDDGGFGYKPIYTTAGYNESDLNIVGAPGNEHISGFEYNLLNDNSFYAKVIHKTKGGQLRFIFQPDSNNSNADGFAIAKLSGFKFKQVGNGIYNMKLKIREVW